MPLEWFQESPRRNDTQNSTEQNLVPLPQHLQCPAMPKSIVSVCQETVWVWSTTLNDPLNITEVTTQAFDLLGEQEIIREADQHACSECIQPYKKSSDAVMDDPAAVVGVDEYQAVPPLAEDNRVSPQPQPASPISQGDCDNPLDVDKKNVIMVVLDGVVMGPMVNFLNLS